MSTVVAVLLLLLLLTGAGGRKKKKPEKLSWVDRLEEMDAIFDDD